MKGKTIDSALKHRHLLRGLLLFFILIPNLLALVLADDIQGVWAHVAYISGSACIILLLMSLFKARTFFTIGGVLMLLGLIEIAHLILNKSTTSLLFVYTVLISESGEASELLTTFWPLVLVVVLLFTVYFICIFKWIRNDYLLPQKLRIICLCVIPLLLLTGFFVQSEESKSTKYVFYPIHDEVSSPVFVSSLNKIFPLDIFISTGKIMSVSREIKKRQNEVENYSFGIDSVAADDDNLVVLVIGETGRYGNFGINGYERNTTPKLSQRSQLVSYDSVFSVANLTTVVVPLLLSHMTPQTIQLYWEEKSIPEAFAEAGYYTAWIANQSFGNRFLMRISQTCNYTRYMPTDEKNETNLDIHLLNYLPPILAQKEYKNQFVVLHTLGCHYRYDMRYPKEFSVYHPGLEDNEVMANLLKDQSLEELMQMRKERLIQNELKTVLVNSYDNAIRYTDYFLDSTIQMLDDLNRPVVMLYVADHGENLFDDDRNLFFHASYGGSVYEYHVPLMVWYSEEYLQKYPEKVEALKENEHKKISSMKVFDTMIDMADLRYPAFDATQSIVNRQMAVDSVLWGVDANMNLIRISEHF